MDGSCALFLAVVLAIVGKSLAADVAAGSWRSG